MTRIPNSKTVVSYAYTIKVNGTPIGTLQGFNPGADRKLERIREIMNEIDDTKEIVPGRTDYTISINRLETYDADMLQALGLPRLATLHELTDPIDIIEEIKVLHQVKEELFLIINVLFKVLIKQFKKEI